MAIISGGLRRRRQDVEAVLEACAHDALPEQKFVFGLKGDRTLPEAGVRPEGAGERLVLLSPPKFRLRLPSFVDRPIGYRVDGAGLAPLENEPHDRMRELAQELAREDPEAVALDADFDPSDSATIWLDPFQRRRIGIEEALSIVEDLLRRRRKTSAQSFAVGVTRWKRGAVQAFLDGPGGDIRFAASPQAAAEGARLANGRVVVWASRRNRGVEEAAHAAGVPVARIEDGFLRSVGLGAGFVQAASLVLDETGIYYDPSKPSDLETLLAEIVIEPRLVRRAQRLRERLVAAGVTKYNLARSAARVVPEGRTGVLVPGQVEDDASILRGAGAIRTNAALLAAVRARRPEAFIVYKPHPDVVAGYRRGAVDPATADRFADAVVADGSITDLYDQCAAIETMTSLAGFEGLLRGLAVTTHGQPFYAGWGLTEDLAPHSRRTRRRSLDELVAAALILYPLYRDPVSGLPCGPETVLDRLLEERAKADTPRGRLASRLRHVYALTRHRLLGPVARRLQ